MFARKLKVEFELDGRREPCLLKWLDSFAMRNFTNDPVFDDTLPLADALLEVGARVPIERLRDDMQDWFQRKSYLPRGATLRIEEIT